MNPANYMKNSITEIGLDHKIRVGTEKQKARPIDLMCGLIVNLGDPTDETEDKIIKMMNTLLSNTVSAEEKKRMLKEVFHITMTEELENEVSEMCNLSQGVYRQGRIEGEMKKAQKTAINLKKMGMAAPNIAAALEVTEELVNKWTINIQPA